MSPLRRHLQRTRRRTAALLTMYAVVALAGLATLRASNKYEWFPFSAWPLFCITPADGAEYRLRIEPEGEYYETSSLREAQKAAGERDFGIETHAIVQGLGRAIRREDEARQRWLVTQLGRRNLRVAGKSAVRVAVVQTRFDPLVRYRTGMIDQEQVVAEFDVAVEGR